MADYDYKRKQRVVDGRRGKQGTGAFDTLIGENTRSGKSSFSEPKRGNTFFRGVEDDEPARRRRNGESGASSTSPKSRGDAKFFLK